MPQARITKALTIDAGRYFKDPEFIAWLQSPSAKMTWYQGGPLEDYDYADVVVGVDATLTGEGTDSDMPEAIWDEIIEICRKHFRPVGVGMEPEDHILVRLCSSGGEDED